MCILELSLLHRFLEEIQFLAFVICEVEGYHQIILNRGVFAVVILLHLNYTVSESMPDTERVEL